VPGIEAEHTHKHTESDVLTDAQEARERNEFTVVTYCFIALYV